MLQVAIRRERQRSAWYRIEPILLRTRIHSSSRRFRFAGLVLFDVERNLIAVDGQGSDYVKAFPNIWTRIQNQNML